MLKSVFNLAKDDVEEQEQEEQKEQVGEGGVVEEELNKVVYTHRKLNKSEISGLLSMLGKTAEGDGYAYLKATCTGMNLTDVALLKSFKHLQFVDISNNYLDLDSLQPITELPYLILIQADKNLLTSAALKKTKYLQVMILNNNQLTSVKDVYQPELSTLEVGYNKIQRVFFNNNMPHIRCLDFRYNFVQDIADFDFPNLDSLYIAGNKIKSLIGLERLCNLRVLHARYNPIKLLDGFDSKLTKLHYVNLRNCRISTLKQIKKLMILPGLDTLVIKGCPYMGGTGMEDAEVAAEEEDPELRIEVLAALQRLKRLNKGVVSPEERVEAKELMKQWLEEGNNDEEEVEEEHNEEESGNED